MANNLYGPEIYAKARAMREDGLTYNSIAAALGIPKKTAQNIVKSKNPTTEKTKIAIPGNFKKRMNKSKKDGMFEHHKFYCGY